MPPTITKCPLISSHYGASGLLIGAFRALCFVLGHFYITYYLDLSIAPGNNQMPSHIKSLWGIWSSYGCISGIMFCSGAFLHYLDLSIAPYNNQMPFHIKSLRGIWSSYECISGIIFCSGAFLHYRPKHCPMQ